MSKPRKKKSAPKRVYTSFVDGKRINNLPPSLGRGASIRMIPSQGAEAIDLDPVAYRKLRAGKRAEVVNAIMEAL